MVVRAVARLSGRRFLHDLSPRTVAIVIQLPLTLSLALVVVIVWGSRPDLLSDPLFLLGLGVQAVLFALAAVIPWERMPPVTFFLMHTLEFIPIGLVLQAGIGTDMGLEILAVIPSIWLAGSQRHPWAGLVLSFVGPLLIVWTPLVFTGAASVENLISVLILPVMLLAAGIAIRVLSASMKHQQRLLERARASLAEAFEASAHKERLLNALVETVDVGVVAFDGDGRTRLVNKEHRQIDALANSESHPPVEPGHWAIYGPGGKRLPAEQNPFRRAALGEEFSDDLILLGTGDRRRAYSTSARALLDHGQPDGAVLTFTDVTDLVNAMTAKDAFLSNVTHELRTPLTSIIGYVDLLREQEGLPPRVARHLEVINRNAERLERLVTDLLSAASGSVDVRPELADLAEVIRLSVATAAPHAAVAGVELVTEVDGPLPAMIDPVRIAQVLDNLLSNAVKYSPGGGAVTVRTRQSDDVVTCEVQDTGMGISPADSDQLFTEFFRSEDARKASIPGVGLGLAITKSIVENHGGSISCTSVLGEGSTFRVLLPKFGAEGHR
jgi:two-component system phosphate regulon sensor histidine kinase PhoR